MNTLEIDRLRDIFTEIQGAEALLRPAPGRRLGVAAVYAAAQNGSLGSDQQSSVRRVHSRMIADGARAALPFARAASSGAAARRGDGCQIRVEQSRAEPDQYFVLVELTKGISTDGPTSLVVCDSDDHCRRFPLPAARDGISQIIADGGSDLMKLINDPSSKVYLR